jgi:hypothetical protein
MKRPTLLLSTLALASALLLPAAAQAQAFRAYLASYGTDAATCPLAAPCRLLPAALAAVASGGEIWMLDSANYNSAPVNVTKSVTILAVPGALGSVVATAGNAIDIGTAGVKVALRNLVVVPLPGAGGVNGVSVTAAATLTVERCLIANLPGHGIVANAAAVVRITDTAVRDNGDVGVWLLKGARGTVTRSTLSGNGSTGLFVIGDIPGTLTTADVADTTLDGNGNGLLAWSEDASAVVKVSVRDSRLTRNSGFGAQAKSNLGAAVLLSAANNVVSHNGTGIQALFAGTMAWISANTVSANATGFSNSSALFESAGNNALRNNVTDTSGTITAVATM